MTSGDQPFEAIDALATIRKNPQMYVPAGVTGENLQRKLVEDATTLAPDAEQTRVADWYVVGSTTDWLLLGEDVRPVSDLFRQITPFSEAGINSMRSEVLVGAFASHAVTSTPSDRLVVIGPVEDDDEIWAAFRQHPSWARFVAFRLD